MVDLFSGENLTSLPRSARGFGPKDRNRDGQQMRSHRLIFFWVTKNKPSWPSLEQHEVVDALYVRWFKPWTKFARGAIHERNFRENPGLNTS